MRSPTYIESNIDVIRNRTQSMDRHQRRLIEIKKAGSLLETSCPKSVRTMSVRHAARQFNQNENLSRVARDNQRTLDKLMKINKRKPTMSIRGSNPGPRTLNGGPREAE